MSEHGYSVKVPERHLKLVEAFAEREPTAGSPPVVEDGSLPSPGTATLSDHTVASRSANPTGLTHINQDPLLQAFLKADLHLVRALGLEIDQ